ncbi:hypothetical protein BU24DRAFT_435601 [Aaosphaeria arxii CBS 175.79]|uniref:Phospholipid metabolism enzyme regulator n=1 Tax=Aaosphaeria arxii CBS 175.79 TaxID=1450172 RepID=A0A6A5XG44_9PLEO|nr:uncharacterized protein BU24DRAFT_435601 [Aaosphaeria arxii CBS 175.79]KAF2012205.1 hypothetical protein BU24DRAFT_435601 [Aaosphaeria arxii CBS 175.79]
MTSNDNSYRSITGALESAEPTSSAAPSLHISTTRDAGDSHDSSTNKAQTTPPPASASASDSGSARRQPSLHQTRVSNGSASPSIANSPLSSRDPSPARPSQRQQSQQTAPSGHMPRAGLRSRKSSTDVSPSRGPTLPGTTTTVPSAAAIQRALSSASIPQLQPASVQDPSRVPRPLKSNSANSSGDNTPHWPVSPRLKSPPPSSDTRSRSRRNSLRAQSQTRKTDPSSTPAIVVQASSPAGTPRLPAKDDGKFSDPEEQPVSMKTTPRGASGAAPKLETVQEGSLPATPGTDIIEQPDLSSSSSSYNRKASDDERSDARASSKVTEDLSTRASLHTESGSDTPTTTTRTQDKRSASSQKLTDLASKASSSIPPAPKSRAEPSKNNMTVETETVPSVAQASIGNQERSASGRVDGSLRLKPSNETIRPRKEKQKPKRKAPSINSGTGRSSRFSSSFLLLHHALFYHSPYATSPRMRRPDRLTSPHPFSHFSSSPPIQSTDISFHKASSKADVFEQKVASAVDEANSSDSDATFIYESNPPDSQPHRSRQHHHSRTPSMTSVTSLADPRAMMIRDSHKNPNKKSSMKFANPYNNTNIDQEGSERGEGTVRVGSARVNGSTHHHHLGRQGQGRGALSHVLVDSDSSMPQSSRTRGPSSRHPSQPNSPRFHTFNMGNGNSNGSANGSRKQGEFSTYDIDAENAADDERTPLISSVRSPRVRTPRHRNSATVRHMERRHRHSGGWCRRFAGCLVLAILVLVLVFSAVGLVFATTKPLTGVNVREIQNVVASQEELMLDLVVDAINPNIIGVTIADMDVNIFAKSKHVGSDRWWREHGGHHENEETWTPISEDAVDVTGGVDEGTDPIGDGEPRTMLLGRIFKFDSPLSFEGSPIKRQNVSSLGGMRLSKPGNKTEAGGTERWEEVLQHPFQLIVRGVFKYQLPLSTRENTVPVTASYFYDPDAEKKKLKLKITDAQNNPSPQPVKKSPKSLDRHDVRGANSLLSLVYPDP